ncbi:hypothetical protein [Leptospira gomenensis]|nr:hypothetical protein [Leptospira gomenensis]
MFSILTKKIDRDRIVIGRTGRTTSGRIRPDPNPASIRFDQEFI